MTAPAASARTPAPALPGAAAVAAPPARLAAGGRGGPPVLPDVFAEAVAAFAARGERAPDAAETPARARAADAPSVEAAPAPVPPPPVVAALAALLDRLAARDPRSAAPASAPADARPAPVVAALDQAVGQTPPAAAPPPPEIASPEIAWPEIASPAPEAAPVGIETLAAVRHLPPARVEAAPALIGEAAAAARPALLEAPPAPAPQSCLRLALTPPGLGEVEVTLRLRGGKLEAALAADSPHAAALVESRRGDLAEALRRAGYEVDAAAVATRLRPVEPGARTQETPRDGAPGQDRPARDDAAQGRPQRDPARAPAQERPQERRQERRRPRAAMPVFEVGRRP